MVEFLDSASLVLSMGVLPGFGVVKFFFSELWAKLLGWYPYTFLSEEVKKDFLSFLL